MAEHFFTPHLDFGPGHDLSWIGVAIQRWEREHVVGTNGRALPSFSDLLPGSAQRRWGVFERDPECSYRLRIEVPSQGRARARLGVLLAGPNAPSELTRGGGSLIDALAANWRHKPKPETFPDRLRQAEGLELVEQLYQRIVDPTRKVPLVVVTRRTSGEPVADPEVLCAHLRGMAEVWSLPTTDATFVLGDQFAARGFDSRWNCYDGGVRVYLAGFDPNVDQLSHHPLSLASRLEAEVDPSLAATRWLLSVVTRALGAEAWRAAWRDDLEQVATSVEPAKLGDIPVVQAAARRIMDADIARTSEDEAEDEGQDEGDSEQLSEPAPQAAGEGVEGPAAREDEADVGAAPPESEVWPDVEDRNQSLRERESGDDPHHGSQRGAPTTRLERSLSSLRSAFDAFAELEDVLAELNEELQGLRNARDELARERDELAQALQDSEHAGGGSPSTAGEMLRRLSSATGGSLRITRYAARKADASRYRNLELLARVLATLLSHGPDFGSVRSALEQKLGRQARAKPRDSSQTMKTFGLHRNFKLDDGTSVTCDQHITLGHGSRNPSETFQIYWRGDDDGRPQIVYAGDHLPTVSHDT